MSRPDIAVVDTTITHTPSFEVVTELSLSTSMFQDVHLPPRLCVSETDLCCSYRANIQCMVYVFTDVCPRYLLTSRCSPCNER